MHFFQSRIWHPNQLLMILAVWLATAGNLPLWLAVWRLPESTGLSALTTLAGLGGVVLGLLLAFVFLLVWPRWLKPAGVLLLLVVSLTSYFMSAYGVVIDPSMVTNAINTDVREARDLFTGTLLVHLLLGVVLPGLWWWRQTVQPVPWMRLLMGQLGLVSLSLLLALAVLWLSFQDMASLMRNHKPVRYMINPFNTVYALTRQVVGSAAHAQQPLQTVGSDARLSATPQGPEQAPLIVLVVGETARAANFGLGGYARDTTPQLRELQRRDGLVYFTDVTSCGTNTHVSLPCLFSHLQGSDYRNSSERFESLLDVLQRAGLAVLWLDNQSGCKGVCDRVPNALVSAADAPELCPGGECQDGALLKLLPVQLAQLDPARRARASVVVLHQMGSHGPAYYKRSPGAAKPFQPECTSHALQKCPPEQLVNAYDNTIHYTDQVLADTVRWLQQEGAGGRPTAMLYVSDHGESLGEKGLYLHGMPYNMAPKEQTHVPMLMWLSSSMRSALGVRAECLDAQKDKPWSHDHFFSTVLELTQVQTSLYGQPQGVLSSCIKRPD
jgi:lipid A ethanolaminephosphotransferase